jgi:prepilin-type N-terminal cleavage/methylation domain-containing protein
MNKIYAFSLIEVIVVLAILLSLATIAGPSLIEFSVKLRVDSEIRQLQRLLLLARNNAINLEQNVTLCPLNKLNICTTHWHQLLSVFTDNNKNKVFEPMLNERIIQVKSAIESEDKLQYAQYRNALVYSPLGRLAIWGGNGTFKYCPKDHGTFSRGIIISVTGKAYVTSDINHDGQDENRRKKIIICK